MSFILLLLLLLLILIAPVIAWLTQRQRYARPSRRSGSDAAGVRPAAKSVTSAPLSLLQREHARQAYRDILQLAGEERRCDSLAYRQAAVSAYAQMQSLADADAMAPARLARHAAARRQVQSGRFDILPRPLLERHSR